jgi:hypothetical protein
MKRIAEEEQATAIAGVHDAAVNVLGAPVAHCTVDQCSEPCGSAALSMRQPGSVETASACPQPDARTGHPTNITDGYNMKPGPAPDDTVRCPLSEGLVHTSHRLAPIQSCAAGRAFPAMDRPSGASQCTSADEAGPNVADAETCLEADRLALDSAWNAAIVGLDPQHAEMLRQLGEAADITGIGSMLAEWDDT